MLVLAQMLSENSGHNLTDSQVSYANTIYSSGQDLLFLINDILDLSKIESGKLSIYPEEIFVSDIKGYVIDQFTPISSRKGINFSVKIEDSTPSIIYTDDQRIKQILKNLLANAFKFTEEGEVELIIKEGKGGNDSKVQFIVKDTGIGISESKVKDIFEEFYQADGTTTRKFGGTGLGLPISQNLSRLLGGYIEVESMEGEGSVFILHIPDYVLNSYDELDEVSATILKKVDSNKENKNEIKMLNNKPQGNKEKLDITIDHLKNKTVLIVDDDMRNVFAMTTALEAQGMMVLFAENGQEAIDVLEINSQIDIVLMDMMMPIMDGYEAMKRIRRNVKFKELPIIALTAKAMKHDKEKCIEAGASDYISKPVDVRRLISVLKVWICE